MEMSLTRVRGQISNDKRKNGDVGHRSQMTLDLHPERRWRGH
jgi:hypothetical protein